MGYFHFRYDKEEFIQFAKTVERIFPGENAATYFTPFRVENKVRIHATGKLKSHFDYIKGQLRAEGVIKPHSEKLTETKTQTYDFPGKNIFENYTSISF